MPSKSRIRTTSCSSVGLGHHGLWFLLLGTLLCGLPHLASAQEIVFAPPSGMPGPDPVRRQDFARMFTAPGEWPVTATHTDEFGLTGFYVTHAPADELNRVLSFIASHHMGLDVALSALPVDGCGVGVEGMVQSTPYEPMLAIRKLQQLGANVTTIALDEPLTFGFDYRGINQCAYSITEVARRLALTIHAMREIYPNAKIEDAEAPTNHPTAEWLKILAEWLSAYQAATGTPLDKFAEDMNWFKPYWLTEAAATVQLSHTRGVKVEIIINRASWSLMHDGRGMAREEPAQHAGHLAGTYTV